MSRRRGSWIVEWGLGLGLVALILVKGDLGDLDRLLRAAPGYLALGLVANAALSLTTCTKWRAVVRAVMPEEAPSWRRLIHYFFLARLTGLVAPLTVSDAGVRVVSLRVGHRVSLTRATYTVYLERSFDLIVVLVTLLPSVLFLSGALGPGGAGLLLALLALLPGLLFHGHPLLAPRLLTRLFLFLRRLVGRLPFAERLLTRGRPVAEAEELPIRESQALLLYVMSLLGLLGLAVRFWFILRAVDIDIGLLPLLLTVPVAQLATILAITPGGLGILEAGWYGLFTLLGLPGPQIVLALVSARAFVVVYTLVLYGLAWWWARGEGPAGPKMERSEARAG